MFDFKQNAIIYMLGSGVTPESVAEDWVTTLMVETKTWL